MAESVIFAEMLDTLSRAKGCRNSPSQAGEMSLDRRHDRNEKDRHCN